jgi:hypothetical protein
MRPVVRAGAQNARVVGWVSATLYVFGSVVIGTLIGVLRVTKGWA